MNCKTHTDYKEVTKIDKLMQSLLMIKRLLKQVNKTIMQKSTKFVGEYTHNKLLIYTVAESGVYLAINS